MGVERAGGVACGAWPLAKAQLLGGPGLGSQWIKKRWAGGFPCISSHGKEGLHLTWDSWFLYAMIPLENHVDHYCPKTLAQANSPLFNAQAQFWGVTNGPAETQRNIETRGCDILVSMKVWAPWGVRKCRVSDLFRDWFCRRGPQSLGFPGVSGALM